MKTTPIWVSPVRWQWIALALGLAITALGQAQTNVLQPGDPILASSTNSPASAGVSNAIDGQPSRYANLDSANDARPSGFVVTPSAGPTLVTGLRLESAADAPEDDPKQMLLEGCNEDLVTDFNAGHWELIVRLEVPAWPSLFPDQGRLQTQSFTFDNYQPYKNYRWTVLHVQGPNARAMQIGEVRLLGVGAPQNIVHPGDPIIASSLNSPAAEVVVHAIDGQPAKYLNFDSANDAGPSGFVVTPSVGPTTVTGLRMESANDEPERDPKVVTVEGSNDDAITDFNSGQWRLIAKLAVPAWTVKWPGSDRYRWQQFYFPNKLPYRHYRWTVLHIYGPKNDSMQIAEVELLGFPTARQ
jgi:hypothetical protein